MARIKMHIPKAKLPYYPPCEVKCRLQNGMSTIIPKRTLGMTQMPMRQSLLKLLVVEPVAVSFLFVVVVVVGVLFFFFFFFFFVCVNSW